MVYGYDYITLETHPCTWCGKTDRVEVLKAHFDRWQAGELIQVAFPEMPADQRELLMSGTHPECWDKLWADKRGG